MMDPAFDGLPTPSAGPRATLTVGAQANCDYSSLQAAIDAAGNDDVIRVARSDTHLGSGYNIYGKGLTIRGGFDTCDPSETASGRTILDANNQASGRVFDINQSGSSSMQVRLENLDIRRGRGGVMVTGEVGAISVVVMNTVIRDNDAGFGLGGGIRVQSNGPGVSSTFSGGMLTVDNDSMIMDNNASVGGGIYCAAQQPPTAMRPIVTVGSALIFRNSASSRGGGVANNGCREMRFNTGGPIVLIAPSGGIYNNTTDGEGGGFHVEGGGKVVISAGSRVGFGDPDHAAMVVSNRADSGGGLFVSGEDSEVILSGTVVGSNHARAGHGGGILAQDDAVVLMSAYSPLLPCQPFQAAGGIGTQPPCSALRDNSSFHRGAAIFARNGAEVVVSQTLIQGNEATGNYGMIALNLDGNDRPTDVVIDSSLISDNTSPVLAAVQPWGRLDLSWSTIAGNDTDVVARILGQQGGPARVRFLSTIAYGNTSDRLVTRSQGTFSAAQARCMIGSQSSDAADLTLSIDYSHVDPKFVDSGEGDFRLQPDSPAIDYCHDDYPPTTSLDLAGNPRGEVWAGPPHDPNPALGPFDLGAYEAQLNDDDVIFADGFE